MEEGEGEEGEEKMWIVGEKGGEEEGEEGEKEKTRMVGKGGEVGEGEGEEGESESQGCEEGEEVMLDMAAGQCG